MILTSIKSGYLLPFILLFRRMLLTEYSCGREVNNATALLSVTTAEGFREPETVDTRDITTSRAQEVKSRR